MSEGSSIMDLKQKRALVTGAARRLGREVVLYLSQKGCQVTAHYCASSAEARLLQQETGCALFQADFSSGPVSGLLDRIGKEVGEVDILINNASSFRKSTWTDTGEEMWDHEFAVNLKVPFFLSQHFGRQMKAKGSGKIINLADIAAYRAYLNYLPYSLAKSGIVALTQALARALAPEVQVNAIAPGTVLFVEGLREDSKKKMIEKIPAGRPATVGEFLETVDFLLSGVDYITGQTLVLDGGRTLTW